METDEAKEELYWVAIFENEEESATNAVLYENLTDNQRYRLISVWLDSARQYNITWFEMPKNETDYRSLRLNHWRRLAQKEN